MLRASDICPNEERSFHEADGETCAINHDKDTLAPSPSKNFGIIPAVVMQAGLTPLQFAVYAYLATCASRDGISKPKYTTIANALQTSKGRIQLTINQLVARKLITKKTKGNGRKHTKLTYQLLHHKKQPFGRLNKDEVENVEIRTALPLLAMLSMRANDEALAWPTRKEQIKLLNKTQRSIAAHQSILVKHGLITVGKKSDGSNLYTVHQHLPDALTQGAANEYSRDRSTGATNEYCRGVTAEYSEGATSECSLKEPNQSPPKHISNHVAAPPLHEARQRDGTADLSDLGFAIEVIYQFLEFLTRCRKLATPFDRELTPLTGKARRQLRRSVSDRALGLRAVIDAIRTFNLEMFDNVSTMEREPNIFMLSSTQIISSWYKKSQGLFSRFGIKSECRIPDWESDLKAKVWQFRTPATSQAQLPKTNRYKPPIPLSPIAKRKLFEPSTDAERAKDDLYDLCRACPKLDLGLGPLPNSVLMPLLETRMAEFGLESWRAVLQSIKENPYLRGDQIPERSEDRLRINALSLASDEYDHFPRILNNDLGSASWPVAILPSDEQQNEFPP